MIYVRNKPSYAYLWPKVEINVGFLPETQIWPIGKNFQEIRLNYKQIHVNGRNIVQNVLSTCKNFQNLSKGLKVTSQKANFDGDHTRPHSCHIMKKGGKKGSV